MEDPSEGCYCTQAQDCPHWIEAKMDTRLATVKEHSHERTRTFEKELQQEDHRPIVSELQRELRTAMLEIEKLAKTSRDLAKINQDLEESRTLALGDQARTAKRLVLVSGQLDHTEQQLFNLTKEMDSGQKDSELLRIERIKRDALQEREDASRLKIETLQDELQEVQRSERMLQQKLITVQTKYETLSKRHDNLKRQQHELELARESKEALAWLKETTDRLCSPPQGSLGQAIQRERSSQGSSARSLHQSSPSSSPPYATSFIDPPLAAQNQLISLIKELATTNSTLRSELNEYRDLLQDTRNEMLALRAQVEDYEQGHAFENCCGARMDDGDSLRTSKSAWSALDIPTGGGLDAVSHIGTLGSVPGSPPRYMTTPRMSSKHRLHQHFHLSGVRGNVFGELERLYSQGNRSSPASSNHKGHSRSSKKSKRKSGRDHDSDSSRPSDAQPTATVSTSTSTSEIRRRTAAPTTASSRSPPNPTPSKLRDQYATSGTSPLSNTSRNRRSMYTDADLDMLGSGSESGQDDGDDQEASTDTSGESGDDENEEPGFVAKFAEAEQPTSIDSVDTPPPFLSSQATSLLPPANLDDNEDPTTVSILPATGSTLIDSTLNDIMADGSEEQSLPKNRNRSISLLSAELQRATRSDTKVDPPKSNENLEKEDEGEVHASSIQHDSLSLFDGRNQEEAIIEGEVHEPPATPRFKTGGRNRFTHHEKSSSDQERISLRQRRRLSEPLHHQPSLSSLPSSTKKSRPTSIYSLRKPRVRLESSSLHCIHSGHIASTGLGGSGSASGGGVTDLQRCKSAELVEQIMVERRQRMMEAWRVGVVAAAVTQQQAIHSVVANGEHRRDTDNISIRSRASRRRVKVTAAARAASVMERDGNSSGQDKVDDTGRSAWMPPSRDSESTIKEAPRSFENTAVENDAEREKAIPANGPSGSHDPATSKLTINIAADEPGGPSRLQEDEASKGKKRRSVRSMRSVRSSLLLSPMVRSSLQARDRRFPSEISTASEAFSSRRYDHEISPYQLLHTLSTDLIERLARSDTRELNRRLKRTFDIQALSQMSNSVIENVLTDVGNLNERFRWLEAQVADPIDEVLDRQSDLTPTGTEKGLEVEEVEDDDDDDDDSVDMEDGWGFSVEEFFPLAHTVQEMLSEIGKLRMTINELQLSYVQKVEQDRIKAERDFMQDMSEEDDEFDERDRVRVEPSANPAMANDKPTTNQSRNVLGMLDRPRILGSASTGVSGFFNKVFGGSGPSQDDSKTTASPKPAAATVVSGAGEDAPESSKEKPTISKSKSGVVLAETSKIFAESAWISSPGKPLGLKTPNPSSSAVVSEGSQPSATSAILVPSSRLSATRSLAAMATMSPARSSPLHGSEAISAVPRLSSARARVVDISFSPDVKDSGTSAAAAAGQSLLSRSLPQDQSFDLLSAEGAHSSQKMATVDYQSMASTPDNPASPHTNTDTDAAGDTGAQTPQPGQRSLTVNRTPRSIDASLRTSGPALNVVTKQDVFQDHWTTSSQASSHSAAVSSRASSERRATVDSMPGGPILEDTGASATVAVQRGTASGTSTSTNSIASETHLTTTTARFAAKPTLITRAALAVTTPSTSTVSSPMSSTSWFDVRRLSGQETVTADGPVQVASGFAPGHAFGLTTTTGLETEDGPEHQQQQQGYRKSRTVTSFHSSAAVGGSSDSATRSLGRASGRDSALAFMRGEGNASSILGSFFQSQSQTNLSQTYAQSQSGAGIASSTSLWKGKDVATESSSSSSSQRGKASVEVLTADDGENRERGDDDDDDHDHQHDYEHERRPTSRQATTSPSPMTVSRSDALLAPTVSGFTSLGVVVMPTTQRAAVTSTAVAYVVATPDAVDEGTAPGGSKKKRAVFDRELIKASQKRILSNIPHQDKPFVPEARPRRARALSVDSAQSTEPLKQTEIMDLWRVGAGVSRDIWRGLIKKVDGGRES
ncbi:hypothetical protein BGZ99_002574 [Dissophora globulifera]|uniref:Uncharacterized protein n=1 Tax=Dissophora globulifera TaxID=979702 RepID=A0A9P6RMK1_9FUNG|nr:hypothetical protein BGZ99_002574 [Dissophora globulifera]